MSSCTTEALGGDWDDIGCDSGGIVGSVRECEGILGRGCFPLFKIILCYFGILKLITILLIIMQPTFAL